MAARLRRRTIATSLTLLFLFAPGATVSAQTGLCASGQALFEARLIDSAVEVLAAAAEEGLQCSDEEFSSAAPEAQDAALALFYDGRAHEARGNRSEAAESYRRSLELNAESTEAREAYLRVGAGRASATPAADRYAAAEYLANAGRHPEALEAAVDTLTETGEVPSNRSAEQILTASLFERLRLFVGSYGWWLAGLFALTVFVWTRFVALHWVRTGFRWPVLRILPPRLRLAVSAEDATGSTVDLSNAFAIRLHEELRREQTSIGDDPRFIRGPHVSQDLPDLAEAPAQARFLLAFWRWLAKQNILTLRVKLLPFSDDGVGCHVALCEPDGRHPRGLTEPSRILSLQARGQQPAPTDATAWQRLVPLAAAWGFFAINTVQATDRRLRARTGTADAAAYGHFLAALSEPDITERLHCYREAVRRDELFFEAQLNLANSLALDETTRGPALQRLREKVLGKIDPDGQASASLAAKKTATGDVARRLRSVWYRAQLSLVTQQLNTLVPKLSSESSDVDQMKKRLQGLLAEIRRLHDELRIGDEEKDGLIVIRTDLRPHVEVLLAGVLDLNYKHDHFGRLRKHVGLPLDDLEPDGVAATAGQTGYEYADRHAAEHGTLTAQVATTATPLEPSASVSFPAGLGGDDPLADSVPVPRDDEAVQILKRYRGDQPGRIHYRLACIWARDARLRSDDPARAREVAVHHLRAAIDKESELESAWLTDPDFSWVELMRDMGVPLASERV